MVNLGPLGPYGDDCTCVSCGDSGSATEDGIQFSFETALQSSIDETIRTASLPPMYLGYSEPIFEPIVSRSLNDKNDSNLDRKRKHKKFDSVESTYDMLLKHGLTSPPTDEDRRRVAKARAKDRAMKEPLQRPLWAAEALADARHYEALARDEKVVLEGRWAAHGRWDRAVRWRGRCNAFAKAHLVIAMFSGMAMGIEPMAHIEVMPWWSPGLSLGTVFVCLVGRTRFTALADQAAKQTWPGGVVPKPQDGTITPERTLAEADETIEACRDHLAVIEDSVPFELIAPIPDWDAVAAAVVEIEHDDLPAVPDMPAWVEPEPAYEKIINQMRARADRTDT